MAATLRVFAGEIEVGRYRIYGPSRTEDQLGVIADSAIDKHPRANRVEVIQDDEIFDFEYDDEEEEQFHD